MRKWCHLNSVKSFLNDNLMSCESQGESQDPGFHPGFHSQPPSSIISRKILVKTKVPDPWVQSSADCKTVDSSQIPKRYNPNVTRYTVHGRGAKTLRFFHQVTWSTSGTCFFQSSKEVSKSGSKSERFAKDNTLWPFFFNFFKIWFSKPHCPQRCVHPSYATRKKWLFSERTNERMEHLFLTSRRT